MELLTTYQTIAKPQAKRRAIASFLLALYISVLGVSLYAIPGTVSAADKDMAAGEHPLSICVASGGIKISMCIAGIFYLFFVDLTSPIAYIGGAMFDTVASLALQGPTYASLMISRAWVIARDVANMVFVFLLLTIAIELILDLESAGVGKKLAKILVVALLINFSFFFTRVTIDVSNMAAHVFYDNITAPQSKQGSAQPSLVIQGVQGLIPSSISEKILSGINPENLLADDNFKKFYGKNDVLTNLAMLLVLFFMFGVINIIVAFVFVTAAFQFLTRIIGLWMAIILSPLAFVCAVLPIGKKYWKEWLDLLLHNAFYAPVFLFMVYIMVSMVSNNTFTADMGKFLAQAATDPTTGKSMSSIRAYLDVIVGVLLRLGIVIGLFYAATKVGSKMGVTAAEGARSMAEKFTMTPAKKMGAAFGGFGYRNTVGSGFGTGYGAGWVDDKFKKTKFANTRFGNALRNVTTKPVAEAKILGTASYRDGEKLNKELRQNQQNIERDKNNKAAVTDINTRLAANVGNATAIKDIEREARAKIQSFTTRDLEAFKPGEISGKDGFARFMSAKQKDAIDGIKDFTDTQKSAIKKDWGKRTALDPTGTGGSSEAPLNEMDDVVAQLRVLNRTTGVALRVTQAGLKKKAEVEADRADVKVQINNQRRTITTVNQQLRGLTPGTTGHDDKLDELERAEDAKKKLEDLDDKLKDFGEKLKKIKHGEGNGPVALAPGGATATEGEFEVV